MVDALAVAEQLMMNVKRRAQRRTGVACRRLHEEACETGAAFERRIGQAVQRDASRKAETVFAGLVSMARSDVTEHVFDARLQAGGKVAMCVGERLAIGARLDPGALKKLCGKLGDAARGNLEELLIDYGQSVVINREQVVKEISENVFAGRREPHRFMPIAFVIKPERRSDGVVNHANRVGKLCFGVESQLVPCAGH